MDLIEQAFTVQKFLSDRKIAFAFVGGIANAILGRPRATLDADIIVLIDPDRLPEFLTEIATAADLLPQNPIEFATETKIIPCRFKIGLRTDIILAGTAFEKSLVERSVDIEVKQGYTLKTCTAEDLIVMKSVSTRQKDSDDVTGIIQRQQEKLDKTYILDWLKKFETILDRSDLVTEFKQRMSR